MILTKSNKDNFSFWLKEAKSTGAVALIDKSTDWTSFDVIGKLRPLLNIKKIGHAGTLDPLATGLLILCFGKATKTIVNYQNLPKKYSGVIKLGATTKTDDSEGEEENITDSSHITHEMVNKVLPEYTGKIMQKPPIFSAKKVKGKRLYKLARKNQEIEIEAVEVEIHTLKMNSFDNPLIDIEVECSKGTYIRALARDIGNTLETGGYLLALRRTDIGEYNVAEALTISDMVELMEKHKKTFTD